MELSDPATPQVSSSPNDATSPRKSGRVKHKPVLLQTDPNASIMPNGSCKRKRVANPEEADVDDIDNETSDLDDSNGDPDEEELKELKEKRRKSRSKKAISKPAAKKPKSSTPKTTTLPVRSAVNGVKKPPKSRRTKAKSIAAISDEGTGLFCKLDRGSQSKARQIC